MTATAYGHRPSHRQVPAPWPDRSTPTLFDEQIPDDSIQGRFDAAHAAHPEVATELTRRARRAVAEDRRVTMKKLWEDLRSDGWTLADGTPFALDNCFTALYARLLMDRAPDLVGVFRLRDRRSR